MGIRLVFCKKKAAAADSADVVGSTGQTTDTDGHQLRD